MIRTSVVQGVFAGKTKPAQSATSIAQQKAAVQLRPGVHSFRVALAEKGGGFPLPRDVQAKMESALGANFSDVRIHVGSEAASIGALAFTWGSSIHFAPGHYNPHTSQGLELLGHELTHVVQQRAGRVSNPYGSGLAVVQDQSLEAEADRMGRMAAASAMRVAAAGTPAAGPSGVISRKLAPARSYVVSHPTQKGSGWEIHATGADLPRSVGSVQLTPSGSSAYLSHLQVTPEHRGAGVAKMLVNAAVQQARARGFSSVHLEARPESSAPVNQASLVSIYQRMGFRLAGQSERGNPIMERVIGPAAGGITPKLKRATVPHAHGAHGGCGCGSKDPSACSCGQVQQKPNPAQAVVQPKSGDQVLQLSHKKQSAYCKFECTYTDKGGLKKSKTVTVSAAGARRAAHVPGLVTEGAEAASCDDPETELPKGATEVSCTFIERFTAKG